jgi:hypothetical protein
MLLKLRYVLLLLGFIPQLLAAPKATYDNHADVAPVAASNTPVSQSNSAYKNVGYFVNWSVHHNNCMT